jgi:hypothetical protein
LKEHTDAIKSDIHKTIVEGEDKDGLISIIDDIRSSTDKSAALLAKAFMDHYDKYNKQLDADSETYKSEESKLSSLNVEYNLVKQKRNSLLQEYNEIVEISKKLKKTFETSQQDDALFRDFMSKVEKLFKQSQKGRVKKLSTPNTQCAVDVLKSHLENDNI